MEAFDPTQLGFTLLERFEFPGGVHVYEYRNHPTVDGVPNFLRLNLYLSRDGSYVTIWHGLLEPIAAEARLANVGKPTDFDLHSLYDEPLFKGHIDSAEAATHILKALRIGQPGHHERPQVLSVSPGSGLRCDFVNATD
ncbi:MAG: hypothetical protein K2Y27_09550 [Xanthobacteraceae bacterium]|nr:hypothetical protein [Xanthobacteraceae bacterium]